MELTGWEEANRVNQAWRTSCLTVAIHVRSRTQVAGAAAAAWRASRATTPCRTIYLSARWCGAVLGKAAARNAMRALRAVAAIVLRPTAVRRLVAAAVLCNRSFTWRSCVGCASQLYKAAQQSVLRRGAGTTFMRRT